MNTTVGRYIVLRNIIKIQGIEIQKEPSEITIVFDSGIREPKNRGKLTELYFINERRQIIQIGRPYQERLWIVPYLFHLDNLAYSEIVVKIVVDSPGIEPGVSTFF